MLTKLHIQNYAIIDEIEIQFSGSLNIITGETGAGKSILMGALSLILGERADTSALLNADKKCFIEGYFNISQNTEVLQFLQDNELEGDEELLIRREISSSGKSRAFINDIPATLQQLKQLASMLVDLHQQFDTLEIGESGFQRKVLDALAGNGDLLKEYTASFRSWQNEKNALEELQAQKNNFNKELDYHQFLFDELNELQLKENELEDIEIELKLLSNAEGIKSTLAKAYFELKENEQPIVQQVKKLANQLNNYSSYHSNLPSIIQRLQSLQIELQDIASEIESLNEAILFDAQRIEWINERIAAGYKLLKKHGVQTTANLLEIKTQLEEKLQAVLNMDDTIAEKEKQVALLLQKTTELATLISNRRKNQVTPLENNVNRLLVQVGMPNAVLKVALSGTPLHGYGSDQIEFLFDANKSGRFEAVSKVASGGELSRLMLCIKSLIAQNIDLPTMIFDEIDTGISGEAARQVGIIMKDLSANRQVICITHQPQIAGKADAHFFVYKEIKSDTIKTNIRLLSQDERITAIAQMLSGERPTAAALENAREMVMN
ncbi:MAG TPA: DNA repair protein RecN [Chitinophagaceae bacterium]|nr:DNA repair protein RecN [Chitinophagaceae bacterium]